MIKLSEKEFELKLGACYKVGFVKDILIREALQDDKLVGREVTILTGITNHKASENKWIIKSIKDEVKKIFGKSPKERISYFGEVELVLTSGKMEG